MCAEPSGLFVFHCSLMLWVATVSGIATLMYAAFGENVPAKPPDSFQATTAPSTLMAKSWLKPALPVNRSALAVITAVEALATGTSAARFVASMSCQVAPLLLVSEYWPKLVMPPRVWLADGTIRTLSRVGEKSWV